VQQLYLQASNGDLFFSPIICHAVSPSSASPVQCFAPVLMEAAVRRMFSRYLIRTGEIERAWSSHLGEGLDDRLAAVYDARVSFSAEEMRQECQQARAFVECMRRYVLMHDVTAHELATIVDNG
jgi:hypothetical protein